MSQLGSSYPYFMTSHNGHFFLKSIPFESQMFNISGRTDIFKTSDSSIVYSIPRYFDPGGIVISNDGKSILYIRNSIYSYNGSDEEIILYYRDGELKKTYKVEELVRKDLDNNQNSLFYRNLEGYEWKDGIRVFADSIPSFKRKLMESPLFSNGKSAFLATKDNELFQFDLKNGSLVSRQSLHASSNLVKKNFYSPKLTKPDFKMPRVYKIPDLSSRVTYQQAFEKEFDFKYDGVIGNDKFKYYRLVLTCLIDYNGNTIEVIADFEDSTLNQKIEDFFLNQKFSSNAVPEITERWYFKNYSSFRKTDSTIAINERLEEKEQERLLSLWRIKQDTLDGVYIPENLEDCFRELNNIMTDNNKEAFRKSNSIDYHMGLGTNLRNRWGLWSSSRLRKYFFDIGVTHPDNMSGIILESYNRILNGKTVDLEQQLKKYNLTPGPKPEIPKDLKKGNE